LFKYFPLRRELPANLDALLKTPIQSAKATLTNLSDAHNPTDHSNHRNHPSNHPSKNPSNNPSRPSISRNHGNDR